MRSLRDHEGVAERYSLGAGINPLVVSQMLGHADISITLGVYGHVTSDMQREATAAMERMLGRRRG